jgi:hypothetical protein
MSRELTKLEGLNLIEVKDRKIPNEGNNAENYRKITPVRKLGRNPKAMTKSRLTLGYPKTNSRKCINRVPHK